MAYLRIAPIPKTKNIGIKVNTLCEHCGKKQTSNEIDYSLTYVACKKCGKEGCLIYI